MAGQILLANPRGGKKRPAPKKNPRPAAKKARKGRRPRRNPIGFGGMRSAGRGLLGAVKPLVAGAAVGAAGAAALDFALRFAPVSIKTGALSHVTKAVAAVALGVAGRRMPLVRQAAQGALTITLYQALRQYVTVPMNLGEITEGDMQQLSDLYSGSGGISGYELTQPALGVNAAPSGGMGEYQMGGYEVYE